MCVIPRVSQSGNKVALTFVNGLDFQLLPQCRVKYEEPDIAMTSGSKGNTRMQRHELSRGKLSFYTGIFGMIMVYRMVLHDIQWDFMGLIGTLWCHQAN